MDITNIKNHFQNFVDVFMKYARKDLEFHNFCLNKLNLKEKKNEINMDDIDCGKYLNQKKISIVEKETFYMDKGQYNYQNCMRGKGFVCTNDIFKKERNQKAAEKLNLVNE